MEHWVEVNKATFLCYRAELTEAQLLCYTHTYPVITFLDFYPFMPGLNDLL